MRKLRNAFRACRWRVAWLYQLNMDIFEQPGYQQRFGGIARLYGVDALKRFASAHVCVVGIGGVGTWVVEALARSGIGCLTLVDADEVCVTNTNRQAHALEGTVGMPKVEAMAQRVAAINPHCQVNPVERFFTESSAEEILTAADYDAVVDAIDSVSHKCLLLAECRQRGIAVVSCGGAGGRLDPSRIRMDDLAKTRDDALLQKVRARLRKEHDFPQYGKFGIPCAFSDEPVRYPWADGTVCEKREAGSELALDCNSGYGTVSMVTGAMGFQMTTAVLVGIAD